MTNSINKDENIMASWKEEGLGVGMWRLDIIWGCEPLGSCSQFWKFRMRKEIKNSKTLTTNVLNGLVRSLPIQEDS